MSRLVARILLAVLMIPAATLVFIIALMFTERSSFRWPFAESIVCGLSIWFFVAAYWLLLWGRSIKWTGDRIAKTILSFAGAALAAMIVAASLYPFVRDDGYLLAAIFAPLSWLILVTIIWRETPAERLERIRSAGSAAIASPNCGYNLTGLQGTRCPECGTQYTLDELLVTRAAAHETETVD